MFILKKTFYFFMLLTYISITGCVSSYAPMEWLPDKDDISKSTSGGWITIVIEDSSKKKAKNLPKYGGEFIAVDDEMVYLLYDSLYIISKENILESTLEVDQKNTKLYGLWAVMGTSSTISNGLFFIVTFPLWLAVGAPVVADDSRRDRYAASPPDDFYWNNINKFSRFPQGVEEINLDKLQPIFQKPIDRRVK